MNRYRGAIAATLIVTAQLVAACGGSAPSSPVPRSVEPAATMPAASAPPPAPSLTGTAATIADLRTKLATKTDDPGTLRDLGLALLQRVRETADPSLYAQAEKALDEAHRLAPDDPLVLVGIGGLQLGKHRFADALETAHAALALAPQMPAAKAVEVDALVELGRYDDAATAAAELVALRVDLTSLARISYLRELHGNIDGAVAAMSQAAASPALAPENTAYVETLLGNLLVYAGRPDEAAAAYDRALATVPNHAAAIAGLGRLAVGRGDLGEAIRRLQQAA